MFPKDHVITYAYTSKSFISLYRGRPARHVQLTDIPESGRLITPEQLVESVEEFPKNVIFWGDPLSVEADFLQMVCIELTNRGHIVTVQDHGRRKIPNRLFMPGVRLDLWCNDRFNELTWHKLREEDVVRIPVIGDEAYETARDLVMAKKSFCRAQFELLGSGNLLTWVLSDKLDVLVSEL